MEEGDTMWSVCRILLIAGVVTVAVGTAAANVICPVTDDTWIAMDIPGGNYGSAVWMHVRTERGYHFLWSWDALVRFDLSSIPPGEFVESATLFLYYCRNAGPDPVGRELNCYQIRGDWDESTVTWNNAPETAGAPTAEADVPSDFAWMEWDVTADVRAMTGNDVPNYGWRILDEDYWWWPEAPVTSFCSKEHGSNPPYLEVVLGTTPVETRSWGSIKALFR